MKIPDESYYGTLGKIKDIDTLSNQSQIVHQNLSKDTLHGHCARMSLWGYSECKGQLIHSICNVAVEDLPALRRGYGDALGVYTESSDLELLRQREAKQRQKDNFVIRIPI